MGHRMSDVPHIYGNNCNIGFDPGETPKYLYVRFSQIVKCPDIPPAFYETPPNDRTFKITQHDVWPCMWENADPEWHVIIDLQSIPGTVIVWLEHLPDGRVYFYDTPVMAIDEGYTYNNLNRDCLLGRAAHGGIAAVTWTHEATDLLEAINMQREEHLFMEMHPLIDGNRVYKFCRLRDATNIAIEFEPD